jgi:putative ABC transport system substrate-binding protein
MKRRELIGFIGGAAAWPLYLHAQQQNRIRLIGVLQGYSENDPAAQSQVAALRSGLFRLGWNEGSNLRIELRWGAGDPDKIRTMARELVDLHPDVILGVTTPATDALARESRTIPIVFMTVADPISSGFAASLARPGGNVTGFALFESALGGKWVELLKEIAPRTVHVALLFNPATAPPLKVYMSSVQAAASSFGIQVTVAAVHTKDEIEGVVAAQARDPGGGLIVMPDPFNTINRELITALAGRYGVPAIYYLRAFADLGGLVSYGDDRAQLSRDAAGYIDRILKGARPQDLPVLQPTKFEFVINLKAARALGLSVPPSELQIRSGECQEAGGGGDPGKSPAHRRQSSVFGKRTSAPHGGRKNSGNDGRRGFLEFTKQLVTVGTNPMLR